MKAFAIITAGLMAVGGGIYFLSESPCSKSRCGGAPVALSGGCCEQESSGCTADPIGTYCDAAEAVAAAVKPSSCCGPKEACCEVQAACCATQKVATPKPTEITGCCSEGVSPARTVISAAKSVAGAN